MSSQSPQPIPSSSQALPPDSILIDTLHLSANIGLDCWRRSRAQPIGLSVYLLLPNGSLNIAGLSDDVEDSVHYGDLTKAIVKFVEGYEPLALSSTVTSAAGGSGQSENSTLDAGGGSVAPNPLTPADGSGSNGIVDFVDKLTLRIFHFLAAQQPAPSATLTTPLVQSSSATSSASTSISDGTTAAGGSNAANQSPVPTVTKVQPASTAAGLTPSSIQARVVLHLPKYILLSPHFSVEVITPSPSSIGSPDQTRIVEVRDLDLPVIIGVNPPERQMKQRVKMTLIFREILGDPSAGEGEGGVDYRHLIADITKLVELSAYLTLERFVYHIVQHACTASPLIQSVTVRAQKPSAIAFAESSGVEITRSRWDFRSANELSPS